MSAEVAVLAVLAVLSLAAFIVILIAGGYGAGYTAGYRAADRRQARDRCATPYLRMVYPSEHDHGR